MRKIAKLNFYHYQQKSTIAGYTYPSAHIRALNISTARATTTTTTITTATTTNTVITIL